MTHPAILPMSPGEKPTERGWYVMEFGGQTIVVEADPTFDPPVYWLSGIEGSFDVKRADTFIARIYPERIEGSEG